MKKSLTFASVVIGALLGASALSVLAQTSGSWTAPTVAPPGGNVAAPLNIGTTLQEKLGSLLIDGNLGVMGNLVIATGTPSAGKVLTALNNTGLVTWTATSSLGIGGGGGESGWLFGGIFEMGEANLGLDTADMSTLKDPSLGASPVWHCESPNKFTGKCTCPAGDRRAHV